MSNVNVAAPLKLSDDAKGKLLALFCPLIWSLSGVFVKSIPWPWFFLLAARGVLSALAIYSYMRLNKQRFVFSRRSLIIAFTVFATGMTYFPALKLAPAASVIALQYTQPLYLMIMCIIFYKTKYTVWDFSIVGFALLGVLLLFLDAGAGSLPGCILAILSGVAFAGTYCALANQSLDCRYSGMVLGNIMLCSGFLFSPAPAAQDVSGSIIAAVLFVGLLQIPVPHIILGKAMRLTSPLACSLIASLEIFLNPLWVYIFIGEVPGKLTIAGCFIILTFVLIWTWRDAMRHKGTQPEN